MKQEKCLKVNFNMRATTNKAWSIPKLFSLQCYHLYKLKSHGRCRRTRCKVLRSIAKVRKAKLKLKRQEWAGQCLKTDFSKVLWTWWDEGDSWWTKWVDKWLDQSRTQGVMVWTGIINNELVGPIWVTHGLKNGLTKWLQVSARHYLKAVE